jgi:hypothetical protein
MLASSFADPSPDLVDSPTLPMSLPLSVIRHTPERIAPSVRRLESEVNAAARFLLHMPPAVAGAFGAGDGASARAAAHTLDGPSQERMHTRPKAESQDQLARTADHVQQQTTLNRPTTD